MELLCRDLTARFAVHAKQVENERTAAIQNPDDGSREPSQPEHRRGHHDRDLLRRAQGKLLGHQLTHNERGIGHKTDHERKADGLRGRSEEHTSELQSLMRLSYAVFCLKTTTLIYS